MGWYEFQGVGHEGETMVVFIDEDKKSYNIDMSDTIPIATDNIQLKKKQDGTIINYDLVFTVDGDEGKKTVSIVRLTDKQVVRLSNDLKTVISSMDSDRSSTFKYEIDQENNKKT